MPDEICVLCDASFRPKAMVGNKCKPCATLHPNANCRDEIKRPNQDRARTLTEPIVREVVYEILESAGIVRVKCEACQKLFFRKSPATKFCPDCRAKPKVVNKEIDNA